MKVALGSSYVDNWREKIEKCATEEGFSIELLKIDEKCNLPSDTKDEIDALLISYDLYFQCLLQPELIAPLADIGARSKWVQAGSAGWDGPVLAELYAVAREYCNAEGVHSTPIAQWCLGQMLRRCKRMDEHIAAQQMSNWAPNPGDGELTDRILGVWGLGSIGTQVARLGKACGMQVWGLKRNVQSHEFADRVLGVEDLTEFLSEVDYLVMCLPHSDSTIGVLSKAELGRMKPTAAVMNVGRGSAIVEEDLVAALNEATIAWAALDTTAIEPLPKESSLWHTPNLVITPHDSAHSRLSEPRLVELFCRNILQYHRRQRLENKVK